MAYRIKFKNDDRPVIVAHNEAILEAAIRAGLSVDYGCNSGNCGLCSARLISGEITKIKDFDYVYSVKEREQRSFLMCSHTAASDLQVDAEIADSAEEISLQHFRAKLSKFNKLTEQLAILRFRVSRGDRFRFMAGQSVQVKHVKYGSKFLLIASCPCDATELEFHLRCGTDSFTQDLFNHYTLGDWFEMEGPYGNFVFTEDFERPVILIAYDVGFASIKSLIEHIIAQESDLLVHLYRLASDDENYYLDNLCLSWCDALDQLSYSKLSAESDACAQRIADDHPLLSEADIYLCLPGDMVVAMKSALIKRGASAERVFGQTLSPRSELYER